MSIYQDEILPDGVFEDGRKSTGVQIEFTEEQLIELLKCSEDPIYFSKYVKIKTDRPTNPDFTIDLRDYQKEMISMFQNHRFNIVLSSRQSGKCVYFQTVTTIRNKKTGEVKEIPIGEFFNLQKNKSLLKSK